ncbi:cytochrome C oxidase subunit IV family protein [Changchengzhania lutea]|uniref:cytochrome C oxidase subunit IV family protein n=1 Tax=Changchengzhania lutea TaxID=2049305 RepID=UPI001FE69141|nr:cytochrome C oxidase subunit IV family protein [Changchengzhania lutea]
MKKAATITWIILIVLTIVSALISKLEGAYIVVMILILAVFKFLGIAFQFMEIKKAHSFWKTLIIVFIFLFGIGLLVA